MSQIFGFRIVYWKLKGDQLSECTDRNLSGQELFQNPCHLEKTKETHGEFFGVFNGMILLLQFDAFDTETQRTNNYENNHIFKNPSLASKRL